MSKSEKPNTASRKSKSSTSSRRTPAGLNERQLQQVREIVQEELERAHAQTARGEFGELSCAACWSGDASERDDLQLKFS